MRVTEIMVRIETKRPNPQIRGFATVVFDDCFKIKRIRVIERSNGTLKVCMPSRRLPANDELDVETPAAYTDIVHPIRPEFRLYLDSIVLAAYRHVVRSGKNGNTFMIPAPRRVDTVPA